MRFEVGSLSINHLYLRNLEIGGSVRVRNLLITFYPDALLLRRELETVKAAGIYINVPRMNRELSGKGGKGGGKKRGPTTYSPFSVRRVVFYGLEMVPSDSLLVKVESGAFSYGMGGPILKASRITLRNFSLNTLPVLTVDSTFGDMVLRRDTLYLRLSAYGRYDTLAVRLENVRMSMWEKRDTTVMDYSVGLAHLSGGRLHLRANDVRARWETWGNPGRLSFAAGEVVWMDTLKVRELAGTARLDSLPSFRLDSIRGRIYGGSFLFNLKSESLRVFRGEARLRSVSPMGLFTVSGYAVFSVDLGDTSLVGGGHLSYLRLRSPLVEMENVDVSVESRGLKRYDFNALGPFAEVVGYYDVSRDEGSMTFNVDRPVRGLEYGRFRLYTFSAKGKVRKRRDRISLSLKELNLWYLLYDTLRIDSIFVRDLRLDMALKNPENLRSEGKVRAFYSGGPNAILSASYSYSRGDYYLSGTLETDTLGRLEVEASGRLLDSTHLSRVAYFNRSVRVVLRDLDVVYRDTVKVLIPSNPLLGGTISGNVLMAKDPVGYRFIDSSRVVLTGVNPTPVFGTFLSDLDVLVDRLDATVVPRGYVEDASVEGKVRVVGFSYGDVPVDSFIAHYRVSREVAGISNASVWLEDHPVRVEVGRYYLPNSTLYVFARAEDFPTDPFLPFLLPDSSRVSFELAVSGKVDSPNVLGYLYWTARSIDLNGNLVKRPKVYAVAEGNRIVLPPLRDSNSARLGKGRVRFNGSIRTNLKIDSLRVDLEHAEVQADPDITAILSGHLNVTGDLRKEVMVVGDLTAEEVEFFKPLTEMASGGTQASASKPILLYDIHIYAPRRIFLNSTLSSQALSGILLEIDAELSADINAQKLTPTLSSVSGNLSFLRGNVYIVDKVFRIDRGEILLYGTSGTVSILSSATFPRMSAGGSSDSVKVFVSIEGEIDRPTVRIWSQPYMATGDILALIVGESNLLGFLSRGLRWELNLTELSIKQTPTSYQLLFGTYITRRIYLKSTLSTTGDYNSIRTLYFVNPNLSIYGERVQDQSGTRYGVGINFRIRF